MKAQIIYSILVWIFLKDFFYFKCFINNKEYLSEHFKIKSNDESLDEDKQFEFDVWYNPKNNLILKVTYNKMGNWEYRLRSFE